MTRRPYKQICHLVWVDMLPGCMFYVPLLVLTLRLENTEEVKHFPAERVKKPCGAFKCLQYHYRVSFSCSIALTKRHQMDRLSLNTKYAIKRKISEFGVWKGSKHLLWGGDRESTHIQKETFWIFKLNATFYSGLNEETEFKPCL